MQEIPSLQGQATASGSLRMLACGGITLVNETRTESEIVSESWIPES